MENNIKLGLSKYDFDRRQHEINDLFSNVKQKLGEYGETVILLYTFELFTTNYEFEQMKRWVYKEIPTILDYQKSKKRAGAVIILTSLADKATSNAIGNFITNGYSIWCLDYTYNQDQLQNWNPLLIAHGGSRLNFPLENIHVNEDLSVTPVFAGSPKSNERAIVDFIQTNLSNCKFEMSTDLLGNWLTEKQISDKIKDINTTTTASIHNLEDIQSGSEEIEFEVSNIKGQFVLYTYDSDNKEDWSVVYEGWED